MKPSEQTREISRPVRLGSEIYDVLLRKLMSLEIEPGGRIGVDALARELGVSQTPVREALSQLEAQGLVVKVHLVGYRAAPQLTRKQFDDLCELRLLLEPVAAAKAAERMNEETLARLEALEEEMRQTCAPGNDEAGYSAFAQRDALFHAEIAAASGNEALHRAIAHQRVHLHLFRLKYNAIVTESGITEHDRILAAFRGRVAEEAAEAMRVHIVSAHDRFRHVFRP